MSDSLLDIAANGAGSASSGQPALEVKGLTITVKLPSGARVVVVDNVSFAIPPAGTLGIVGESGSGKTMTSLAIMGLLPAAARIESGSILLDGDDLVTKSQREMRRLRGRKIGMVMQDSMTALDPSFTVRSQLAEPLRQHGKLRGRSLDEAIATAVEQVQLSASKDRLNQYPHQLSGGMRQRITSAIALSARPGVLIADEPTTALDVTTQVRYLQLLRELQQETGFALLLIAHDLMVVQHVCQHVMVMYSGQAVEFGAVGDVFAAPQHPYTKALLDAIPVMGEDIHLQSIDGQAPEVADVIPGCRFAPRCTFARDVCLTPPPFSRRERGGTARCWGTDENGWVSS